MREMEQDGLVVNEYFLCILLIAYAVATPRQAQRAEQAFLRAKRDGVKINQHIRSALARGVGRVRAHELVRV